MRGAPAAVLLSWAMACAPPTPVPEDAGRPVVDAGPPRVVDGGTVGPFRRGSLSLTQRAQRAGTSFRFTASAAASFLEVSAGTPNPCVERSEGPCVVRVCNLEGAVSGRGASAGLVTLENALVWDRSDAGPADGGLDGGLGEEPSDGGVLSLVPSDGGFSAVTVNERLFTAGLPLVMRAAGDEVPAFVTPPLPAPAQIVVSSPRCEPACRPVSREFPLRVDWTNGPSGSVSITLVGRQVQVRCLAQAFEERFDLPASVLSELPPSVDVGDDTLIVAGETSLTFDAGGWEVLFSASTPSFIPLWLE